MTVNAVVQMSHVNETYSEIKMIRHNNKKKIGIIKTVERLPLTLKQIFVRSQLFQSVSKNIQQIR